MKALAADDPRMIGEYRLQAQLGAGGMGRVYLGLSPGGRAVAIKVVHPDLARDTEFLRRFGQEVAAARAVSGIYTAPVVASGLNEHPPWLATAFVPGPSLDQVVTEHGPMPELALWPLLAGLVEALQAIHACKVVHRDLKPANVLLATDGPRVIDFGISRATDGTALTAAGVVFGTPGYMSPEQAEGRPAGPESDVFELGCVMTYATTGAGPFGSGTAAAVLYRVVHGEPALDAVPPRLRGVVSACLAKDPAARPTLRAVAAMIASGMHATGPSAVAFWPQPVAGLIGAYQARLERETRAGGQPAEAGAPSWAATAAHPPTKLSEPGSSQGPQQPLSPAGPGNLSSPAFPYSQGYSSPQSYPPPQGYGDSQASPPPPRGYLPASGGAPGNGRALGSGAPGSGAPGGWAPGSGAPGSGGAPGRGGAAGYPQPYRLGSRGPIYQLPSSVATAVRLMYAGAAYTLIYALGVVLVASAFVKDHPLAAGRTTVGGVAFVVVLLSLVEIALWLWIARACRNGRNWARVTGTVLFGLHTLSLLAVLGNSHPGIGPAKVLTLISWLIACGAVVFLWQRPSSAFFRSAAPASLPASGMRNS